MTNDGPKTPSKLPAWLANDDDAPIDWAERRLQRKKLAEKYGQEVVKIDPNGPPLFEIKSQDWWVKVVGMLCHNWALIEERHNQPVIIYFFHDYGFTKLGQRNDGRSAIVDSLEFDSLSGAKEALIRNGFDRLEENPGPWDSYEPPGNYYDAQDTEAGIYSKGVYWVK